MVGGVVLDELPRMVGDHLPVVDDLFRFCDVTAVFFALSMMAGRETFSW